MRGDHVDPQKVERPDDYPATENKLPDVTYNDNTHQLRLDGKPIPTATGVSGLLDKPGLPWGAANETSAFVVYKPEEWQHLPPVEAYHRIRKHHKGVWNEKAARGTTVHALAMEWAQGKEIDCPAELTPYVDALERFYRDHDPHWSAIERSVLYLERGREYGGKFDYIRATDDGLTLGDIKTGRRYPIETTLQISGYRFAEYIATYEKNRLTALEPMPDIARCEVLYLHGDGTYELLELPADEDTFDRFLKLRDTWSWLREMERWEKRHPEPAREDVAS